MLRSSKAKFDMFGELALAQSRAEMSARPRHFEIEDNGPW
jgi:hypothetical protein